MKNYRIIGNSTISIIDIDKTTMMMLLVVSGASSAGESDATDGNEGAEKNESSG